MSSQTPCLQAYYLLFSFYHIYALEKIPRRENSADFIGNVIYTRTKNDCLTLQKMFSKSNPITLHKTTMYIYSNRAARSNKAKCIYFVDNKKKKNKQQTNTQQEINIYHVCQDLLYSLKSTPESNLE